MSSKHSQRVVPHKFGLLAGMAAVAIMVGSALAFHVGDALLELDGNITNDGAGTVGNMAHDAIVEGKSGLMAAIDHGCYNKVPIPDPKLGPRKVDLNSMYNTERYRPNYSNKLGLPIFLTKA